MIDLKKLISKTSFTNKEVSEIFKVSPQGGMRISRTNNCLVLIHKINDNFYADRWQDDILYYLGHGQVGDQEMKRANKALLESQSNNMQVFLFESHKKNDYRYVGRVLLAKEPFTKQDTDINGEYRKVIVFPLKKES
jgi:5-methylcytosine-specific restriction protein A